MMEFEGEFTCDGTPEDLWKYFTDPSILQDAAPGCEELRLETPSRLSATLAVGVGSVKPSFDVDALVVECDRPDRLELRASGTASRNSFEVAAWQELTDNGDGTTTVNWNATADVSGIIASMGERALGSVANKLVGDFFRNLEDHVNAGTPAESRLEAASDEEIQRAGYGPETAETEAAAGSGSERAATRPGWSAPPPSPLDSDWRLLALAAGAVALAGALLWRRIRPGGDDTDASSGSGRVRHLLAGAALALLGKRLLDDYLGGAPGRTRDGASVAEAEIDADATVGRDEDATTDPGVDAKSDGESDSGGYFDENPLDRLESRYSN